MNFPKPKRYTSKVSIKEKLTEKVFRVRFNINEDIDFLPGQFANVFIDRGTNRSYSIFSKPGVPYFETLVDISPGGIGSKFFEKMEIGDEVDTMLPLGRFIYNQGNSDLYFIATGTGVVPFNPMIVDELENLKSNRKIKLVWGVRNIEDIILQDEFNELSKEYKNFEIINCISGNRMEEYFSGRVTDYLKQNPVKSDSHVYICGGQEMIGDVEELVMDQGVDKDSVFYEQFY